MLPGGMIAPLVSATNARLSANFYMASDLRNRLVA
jgi:hypothetical protein